jgi:hypothetical protein
MGGKAEWLRIMALEYADRFHRQPCCGRWGCECKRPFRILHDTYLEALDRTLRHATLPGDGTAIAQDPRGKMSGLQVAAALEDLGLGDDLIRQVLRAIPWIGGHPNTAWHTTGNAFIATVQAAVPPLGGPQHG